MRVLYSDPYFLITGSVAEYTCAVYCLRRLLFALIGVPSNLAR